MSKLTVLVLAILILTSIVNIGAATEIIVNPGNSIQDSINSAASGDTIIVMPGTYTENIKVNKDEITIKSDSGDPDDTVIKSRNSADNVFFVEADRVEISGLTISGSARYGYAGIFLSSCSYCTIENNKLLSNSFGINLLNSKSNIISKNIVSDGYRGIYSKSSEGNIFSKNTATGNDEFGLALQISNGNVVSGNLIFNNERGIYLGNSDSNTVTGNTVYKNKVYGFNICGRCDKSLIYNNYFNDTTMTIGNGKENAYNITKTSGTNIVGGPYLGGNYWAKPDGTGFSQKAVDNNGDGLSDSAYKISSKYSDLLPLVVSRLKADFLGAPRSGGAPLVVTFTDTSTGSPTSWKWSFGDGNYSTEQNPVHKYYEKGSYIVTLSAIDGAGSDTNTKYNYITVSEKPEANFSGTPISGSVSLRVTFTDLSTGSPTSWKWNFGDGNYSTEQNPVHVYYKAGNYTVTLTASNGAGSDTNTKYNYIKVSQIPEKVKTSFWGTPRSGNAPLDVIFTDISTGSPTSWKWSFGDGNYSTEQNPIHVYYKTGNYSVTLKTSNEAGNYTIIKHNYITVSQKPEKPDVNFWGTPRSGNAPLNVTFTDISTGSPTSWNWNFGDGNSSTEQNPVHKYSNEGNYTVTLTASNGVGNDTNTKYSYIKVSEKPEANFWGTPRSGDLPLDVTFTDISTGSPTSWKWSFGDGNYSTEQNPVHNYSEEGNYTVILTASNGAGNDTNTKYDYITVSQKSEKLEANFWGTPRSGSAPLDVTFTDISTGSPTIWKWSFGDGNYSTEQNPSHTYNKKGKYSVRLTVNNEIEINSSTIRRYIVVS